MDVNEEALVDAREDLEATIPSRTADDVENRLRTR
jgi:hypothetical protein